MKKILAALAASLLCCTSAYADVASIKVCDSVTLAANTTTDCTVIRPPAARHFSYQVYCNETTDDSMSVDVDFVGGSSATVLAVPAGLAQLKTAYTTEAAWSSIEDISTPMVPFGTIRFTENNNDDDIVCSAILNVNSNLDGSEDATFTIPYVRHIQVPATTAGTVADQATDTAVGTAHCLTFATSADKYAYFQWEIPEDWTGGDLIVEIDWLPIAAIPENATLTWDVNYVSIAEGEAINATATNLTTTITAPAATIAQYKTVHTPFTIAHDNVANPLEHEDHLYFQIMRDVSEDDFNNSACVTAFEIIYTSDGLPEGN